MDRRNKLIRFDWAIKHLLRQKQNFEVLEGFLSALLEDDQLTIIQLLDTEANQANESDKFNRVDILVEDANKRQIIIEVQNTRESHYLERMLYGTSKNIADNIHLGNKYDKVVKVISISILYFNLGLGKDYLYKGKTNFIGMTTGEPLTVREKVVRTDELGAKVITFETKKDIFPEYYLIQVERYKDEVENAIDEWVYMLKHNEVKEEFTSKNIDKAKETLREMNMTEEELKQYQRFLENLAIEKDQIDTAKDEGRKEGEKIGIEKGKKIGIEKGKKIGIEKGKKIGIEKGKLEGEKIGLEKGKLEGEKIGLEKGKLEGEKIGEQKMLVAMITNGHQAGFTPEALAQITGMAIEAVQQVLKEHDLE